MYKDICENKDFIDSLSNINLQPVAKQTSLDEKKKSSDSWKTEKSEKLDEKSHDKKIEKFSI